MSELESLKSQVQIRTATEQDVPFIFNSWLRSYKASQRTVTPAVYFDFQHKLVQSILQRSNVNMLCSPDDSQQLFGYLVHEVIDSVPVLHYGYIKHDFRQLGLMSVLLKHAGVARDSGAYYTHETNSIFKVRNSYKLLVYNPYLASGGLS